MALGRTAKYYRENPEARKKRQEYQKKYDKRKAQRIKRARLNRENRRRGTYGNGDGLDVSHMSNGRTRLEKQSKNRGNRTRTCGDRRARGKKKR